MNYLHSICIVVFIFLIGCSTTSDINNINLIAQAKKVSYTDSLSRLEAKKSQIQLVRRSQNYLIGAGDVLQTRIFELEAAAQATTLESRVAEDGYILLPVIGPVNASGKTVSEIQKHIEQTLIERQILIKPLVNLQIKEFNSKKIGVIGAVKSPGIYALKENVTTLLDILGEASGLSDAAGYVAYVIKKADRTDLNTQSITTEINNAPSENIEGNLIDPRDDAKKIPIDMFELIEQGNLELNMVLEDGDVVFVPNAEEFTVDGYVNKAGRFPLKKPTTILEAVALAGGIKPEASPTYCLLKRQKQNGEELMEIDLTAITETRAQNIYMQVNDILLVRQTFGKFLYKEINEFINIGVNYNPAAGGF